MLKEIIAGIPIAKLFTMQELQQNLTRDFIVIVNEMTGIDITKNF